ncbi:MAG: HAMP domain-containing histidine kinase [Candidatus Melainabacteria bacterium]|nr:HAMP domain-containing histidine kinase [Candidatus Melainabacteria bacterium]
MKKHVELKLLLLTLVCVPLVFNLFFAFLMMHLLDTVDAARSKHVHARTVGTLIGDYGSACLDGSTYAAFSRSGSEEDRLAWWGISRKIESAKAKVMYFVRNDDDVRSSLENFDFLYQRSRRKMRHSNRQMEAGLRQKAIDERISSFDANNTTLQYMRPILMKEFESARAEEVAERRQQDLIQTVIISCALLSTAVAGCLMYFINRRIVMRSGHLAELVNKIAAGEALGKRPQGDDEFSRTQAALYDMAVTLNQARDREKSVFENAVDVIFQLDSDFKIMRINSACLSVWGYDEQAVLGESILKLIQSQDIVFARKVLAGCIESHAEGDFETRIKRADGSVLYAAISARFSKDSESLFCIAHDITEKKTIELQKEELLASASHDVRTPLTSIQITLSLLERGVFGVVPAQCSARLEAAKLSSAGSIDLISDFLDLEKISARKSRADIQVLMLEELVDDAIDFVDQALSKKHLKVETKGLDNTRVYVDKYQYTKVLRNLLKYCIGLAAENASIEVKAECERDKVVLRITCSGTPMAEALADGKLVKRVGGSSIKEHGNFGMSLALVKKIVENHGNSIEIDSADKGRFGFKIAMPGSQTG